MMPFRLPKETIGIQQGQIMPSYASTWSKPRIYSNGSTTKRVTNTPFTKQEVQNRVFHRVIDISQWRAPPQGEDNTKDVPINSAGGGWVDWPEVTNILQRCKHQEEAEHINIEWGGIKTWSRPRRPLFLHALSFECTSKLCINFINQFSVYFHI